MLGIEPQSKAHVQYEVGDIVYKLHKTYKKGSVENWFWRL